MVGLTTVQYIGLTYTIASKNATNILIKVQVLLLSLTFNIILCIWLFLPTDVDQYLKLMIAF